jgi:mannose-6-phosphate isomerase class I
MPIYQENAWNVELNLQYILGMANSDNVIRAGFTPKFIDRKTLEEVNDHCY